MIKFKLRDCQDKFVGYEKWYRGAWSDYSQNWVAKPQWLYSRDGVNWAPEYIVHRDKELLEND